MFGNTRPAVPRQHDHEVRECVGGGGDFCIIRSSFKLREIDTWLS